MKVAKSEPVSNDAVNVPKQVVDLSLSRKIVTFVEIFGNEAESDKVRNEILVLSDHAVCLLFLRD